MKLQPVILCGGSGTRLWPLSRQQHPKQLLTLNGEHSMLQNTALRLPADFASNDTQVLQPLVVANEDYRFVTAEQLRSVGLRPEALLLEPFGRNTAPALTLAALQARSSGNDPVLVVMPADHVITDVEAFRRAVCDGARHAGQGQFVTFGVKPTEAHTGYGYIRASGEVSPGVSWLHEFIEKPDLSTAERYLCSGEYLWNSGIFLMKASAWLAEIARWRPDISGACEAAFTRRAVDHDFVRIDREAFGKCPSDSVDYAVMERLTHGSALREPRGVVVDLEAGWSDVGAWGALWQIGEKDDDGNVMKGDISAVDTKDSLILAQSRLVACVGLRDSVVVETADAVLVGHRTRIEDLKQIVSKLKADGRPECALHRKVHRPWGWFDSICAGDRFQVKQITVNPGASLSLQMHHHRAEHWIVVTGTARVTRGEEMFIVSENESTYIPLGAKHCLENPGKVPLQMIEVQSGAYLGEDDIVRFDDRYGRN